MDRPWVTRIEGSPECIWSKRGGTKGGAGCGSRRKKVSPTDLLLFVLYFETSGYLSHWLSQTNR